jgi:hypothetical protein
MYESIERASLQIRFGSHGLAPFFLLGFMLKNRTWANRRASRPNCIQLSHSSWFSLLSASLAAASLQIRLGFHCRSPFGLS